MTISLTRRASQPGNGTAPRELPPTEALRALVRGAGAPLLVIPGLDGGTGMPTGLTRYISELEIRGLSTGAQVWRMGRPPGVAVGTSIPALAAIYAATIRSTFAEPVDLLGVSSGGSIALQLAADHPDLVRRLVMVSSAHRLGDHGRDVQRRVSRLLTQGRPRRASAVLVSNVAVSAPARGLLAVMGWLAPRLVIGRSDDDLQVLLHAEDDFDLTARLGSITAPTLVLAGSRDRFYPRGLYESLADALPDGTLRLTRTGHLSMHGNRRLAQAVLAFLG